MNTTNTRPDIPPIVCSDFSTNFTYGLSDSSSNSLPKFVANLITIQIANSSTNSNSRVLHFRAVFQQYYRPFFQAECQLPPQLLLQQQTRPFNLLQYLR